MAYWKEPVMGYSDCVKSEGKRIARSAILGGWDAEKIHEEVVERALLVSEAYGRRFFEATRKIASWERRYYVAMA